MKRTLLSAALVLTAAAAPALAADQLALGAGVEPGVYTTAQLAALEAAQSEDNAFGIRAIKDSGVSQTASRNVSTTDTISGGRAQLAASLGVDPADYTLPELARMYSEAND